MLKQPIKYVACLLTMGVLFITSCKKDNTNPSATNHQLIKVSADARNFSEYAYNSDGLLGKIISSNSNYSDTITLSYNANKQVQSFLYGGNIFKYTYDANNQFTKIEVHVNSAQGDIEGYTTYTWQSGKIIEAKSFINYVNGNTPDTKVTMAYNTNGDLVTQTEYYWDIVDNAYKLRTTTTYEYDDKKNPNAIASQVTPLFLTMSYSGAHNVANETVKNEQNIVIEKYAYSYLYDTDGYPTQQIKTAVNPNGPGSIETVHYSYK